MKQLFFHASARLFVAAFAVTAVTAVTLPPQAGAAVAYVQCGSGVTDPCGSTCVDRTWYGACDQWRTDYRQTGSTPAT